MMKKTYTKPALEIVLLKSNKHLLGDSEFQVRGYGDGGTNNVGDTEEN